MCRDGLYAKQSGERMSEGEGEHIIRVFAIEAFSANAVDMRENQVYCILRESIEAFSFWHNVPEKGVIFSTKGF